MIALLICTYNRPQYLEFCLKSLKKADLSKVKTIMIIDDCSTDKKTITLIEDFIDSYSSPWVEIRHMVDNPYKTKPLVLFIQNNVNKSIKGSLFYGFDLLFKDHSIVINLDSDAIVNNKFIDRLLELKQKYPALMVTGFNCNTLNKNGTVRHKHLYSEDGATFRQSVGGINLCINKENYYNWVRPALFHTINNGGNWDALSCKNSMAESCPIAVTVPSVIDHIGIVSSMGHTGGPDSEPPDTADDFIPLSLPNVTLIGVADDALGLIKAAEISTKKIKFGDVRILSSWYTSGPDKIRTLGSKTEYSKFIFKELVDYINTDYFILFQADGFVLNWEAWDNINFCYDYIGAVWNWYNDGYKVGNGGFSFRSKKLHIALKDDKYQLYNDTLIKNFEEDHNICRIHRDNLEEEGIRFASEEVANKFSIEAWAAKDNKYYNSFGFHGFSVDFQKAQLPYIPYLLPNPKRKIF